MKNTITYKTNSNGSQLKRDNNITHESNDCNHLITNKTYELNNRQY